MMNEQLSALNALEDGILIIGPDDQIIFMNQALCKMLNLTSIPVAEINGRKRSDVLNDDQQTIKLRYSKQLSDQQTMEVYSLHDMHTVQQHTIEEIDQLRDQLMSRISHEVKTPLTSVLGFAYMMQSRPDAPLDKRAKWASFIYSKSESLNRIIDNILDLDARQYGQPPIVRREVDLRELVQNVVTEVGELTPGHQIELSLPDQGVQVLIDPDRIASVVNNLIYHAIKATPVEKSISVAMQDLGEAVQVAITDQGSGLTPDQRDHVFEPFSAEPGAIYQPGKGMWLPLAKALIEAHDGHIWFESTPDTANTFFFTIPCALKSEVTKNTAAQDDSE